MKNKTRTNSTSVCPKCEGAGYVLTDSGAIPCDCQKEAQFDTACRLARIPRKFLTKSLENFTPKSTKQREVLHSTRAFLQTFGKDDRSKGLLLIGREGTGKTHVAISVLKEVLRRGFTGLYWNVPELFLELRRIIADPGTTSEADVFDEARRVDLLVLDDLGAERQSEYVTDRLYVLINGRYENDTATIITTNRTRDELKAQLGPRIVSRIGEMTVDVEFPEGDYRVQHLR